jgi:hypothetical protein
MGSFGLGGLNRKGTWLYPVATVADLPPTSINGAVVVALDTTLAYEYDASIPGWIPFTSGGGGGGTTNIFRWSVGTPWSTVYGNIIGNGGFGVIIVDPDVSPRSLTGTATNLTDVFFLAANTATLPVQVNISDGVILGPGGALRSKNILWKSLAATILLVSPANSGLNFEFDGGGIIGWSDPTAITPISVSGSNNGIALRNGATFTGAALTGSAAPALVQVASGGSVTLVATSGSSFGTMSLTSSVATTSALGIDASSQYSATTAVSPATLSVTLLDVASLVFYNDFLVTPQLGTGTVQGAIDALKQGTSGGTDRSFPWYVG